MPMPSDATPETPPWRYLGFWDRLVASLLDNVLLLFLIIPAVLMMYGLDYFFDPLLEKGVEDVLLQWGLPAVFVFAFWIACQATPGKLVFGSRIVDARDGGKPGAAQWAIRYLGYFVSLLPLGLGFWWVAFDPRKQGWHDKLAHTVVVHRGTRGDIARFDTSPRPGDPR